MGSLNVEASSFSPGSAVLDGPITLVGASSEEDAIAGEVGQDDKLGGVGKLRITSFRPWSAWLTQ